MNLFYQKLTQFGTMVNISSREKRMDMANYFMMHPELKHGAIKLLSTPDEEIGRGVDKVD